MSLISLALPAVSRTCSPSRAACDALGGGNGTVPNFHAVHRLEPMKQDQLSWRINGLFVSGAAQVLPRATGGGVRTAARFIQEFGTRSALEVPGPRRNEDALVHHVERAGEHLPSLDHPIRRPLRMAFYPDDEAGCGGVLARGAGRPRPGTDCAGRGRPGQVATVRTRVRTLSVPDRAPWRTMALRPRLPRPKEVQGFRWLPLVKTSKGSCPTQLTARNAMSRHRCSRQRSR